MTSYSRKRMLNGILTDREIREIRRLRATGQWSYVRLASRYGVSGQTIRRIDLSETYKDVR